MGNRWSPRNNPEENRNQATTTTVLEKPVERPEKMKNDRSEPAFRGMDSEDPKRFLQELTEYLVASRHPYPSWMWAVPKQKWYHLYINAGLTWEAFKHRFLVRFDDPHQIVRLTTELYGEHQEVGYCTSHIYSGKSGVSQEPNPNISDSQVTLLIYQTLHPEIRLSLESVRNYKNPDALVETANQIQTNLAAMAREKKKTEEQPRPQQKRKPVGQTASTSIVRSNQQQTTSGEARKNQPPPQTRKKWREGNSPTCQRMDGYTQRQGCFASDCPEKQRPARGWMSAGKKRLRYVC